MDALSELLWRQWTDLLARPSGPFAFRFLLQPTMAIIAAVRDGLADARAGRSPYLWAMLTGARAREGLLREGFRTTSRIILLGLVMDAAYQIVRLRTFYPAEAVIISLVLAFLPYLLTRGFVTRVASWWMNRASPGAGR